MARQRPDPLGMQFPQYTSSPLAPQVDRRQPLAVGAFHKSGRLGSGSFGTAFEVAGRGGEL